MNSDLLERPILTPTDLYQYWQELMHPLGFTERRLYIVFLDADRRAVPVLHEISGVPLHPTSEDAESLLALLAHFGDEFAFAILLARPGDNHMNDDDRAWPRLLAEASARFEVELEPLHLATDSALLPFAPDDLVA
ncbi:MAG: hypothetical protein QM779_04165 [Propionicimonas sp.]|uniref:hypothetical protein n=1 Tax=Propionicimonas sp. TaxID=1955623 RepID=UPI003D0E4F3B